MVLTLSESLGLFRDDPVASFNVLQAKSRKELTNDRYNLVRHVLAPSSSDEKRGFFEACLGGIFVGKVP